jgi:hypothetical protein
VLDACAAPGGKTGALLEACRRADIADRGDIDAGAPAAHRREPQRLRREAQARRRRSARESRRLVGRARFDRILLDAPCSATGVIRRHPDIKLLRRPTDIAALAATQRRMLRSAACRAAAAPADGCCTRPARCCRPKMSAGRAVLAGSASARTAAGAARRGPLPPLLARAGAAVAAREAALTDGFYYAC